VCVCEGKFYSGQVDRASVDPWVFPNGPPEYVNSYSYTWQRKEIHLPERRVGLYEMYPRHWTMTEIAVVRNLRGNHCVGSDVITAVAMKSSVMWLAVTQQRSRRNTSPPYSEAMSETLAVL
jgi:hypothetical protein